MCLVSLFGCEDACAWSVCLDVRVHVPCQSVWMWGCMCLVSMFRCEDACAWSVSLDVRMHVPGQSVWM